MNNKKLGNSFENEMCDVLAQNGYWVHFITPDARGAQPFDIVAVKDKKAIAIECKTLTFSRRYFTIDRLETNQILAFKRWKICGNGDAIIVVKQNNNIVSFTFSELIESDRRIDMKEYQEQGSIEVNGLKIYGIIKDLLDG